MAVGSRSLWSWIAASAVLVSVSASAAAGIGFQGCSASHSRGGDCGYFDAPDVVAQVLGAVVGVSAVLGAVVFPAALALCKKVFSERPRADIAAGACSALAANAGGFAVLIDEGATGQLAIGLGFAIPVFLAFGWLYWTLNGRPIGVTSKIAQ